MNPNYHTFYLTTHLYLFIYFEVINWIVLREKRLLSSEYFLLQPGVLGFRDSSLPCRLDERRGDNHVGDRDVVCYSPIPLFSAPYFTYRI